MAFWYPDGTVALPSFTFAADPNTGLYRIGADNIGMTCGGVKQVDVSTTRVLLAGRLDFAYTDSSGTPGNATINQASGRAAIAAGASAMTLTNSLVSATSIVIVQVESADATLGILIPVPGATSVVVTNRVGGVATNVTANTKFSFLVVDP